MIMQANRNTEPDRRTGGRGRWRVRSRAAHERAGRSQMHPHGTLSSPPLGPQLVPLPPLSPFEDSGGRREGAVTLGGVGGGRGLGWFWHRKLIWTCQQGLGGLLMRFASSRIGGLFRGGMARCGRHLWLTWTANKKKNNAARMVSIELFGLHDHAAASIKD